MSDLARALAAVKRRFVRAYSEGVAIPDIADRFNVTCGKIDELRRLFDLPKRHGPAPVARVEREARRPKPTEKKTRASPVPLKMTEKQVRAAHALLMTGLSVRLVAEELHLNPQQVGLVRSDSIAAWWRLQLGPAYPPRHPKRRAWLRAQRRRA